MEVWTAKPWSINWETSGDDAGIRMLLGVQYRIDRL